MNPFSLKRKADLYRYRRHTSAKRVVSIEPCGRGLVSCITVDSEDHLFVANGYTLTHNCDWELLKLPIWMAGVKDKDYKRNVSDHSLVNFRNFSQINAFAATADAGRAGRYKWFLCDELAFWDRGPDSRFMTSIRGSTESRLVVSTPNGSEGEYYSFMHTPSNAVRLVLDWRDNPTKNRGLYKLEGNKPVAIDPEKNPLPDYYNPPDSNILKMFSALRVRGFTLENRVRSPWYDGECMRADSTPQTIAQELDRDYGGSVFRIFQDDFRAAAAKTVKKPRMRGMITYHPETLTPQLDSSDDGQLLLWTTIDHLHRPPARPYVVGADVGTGLGGSYTSNSAVSVIDLTTQEQVAEMAINTMQTADFADFCMALSKWFYDAYLVWEANGPGMAFSNQVLRRQYGNVFYRTNLWKNSKKKSKEVGWWTTKDSKEAMFSELIRSVRSGEVLMRSEDLAKECNQYVRLGGKIEHVLATTTEDDSSKGTAHGDRVIAFAVALQGLRDRPVTSKAVVNHLEDNPPPDTMAARDKAWRESQKKDRDSWDSRENSEIASGMKLWKTAI